METGDEIADQGHDAYEPDRVCTPPPWQRDGWAFCAKIWLEVMAKHKEVPLQWSSEEFEAVIAKSSQSRDWSRRFWAAAAGLADDHEPRELLLDLLLLPGVPKEVVAGFETLLAPLDPPELLLPKPKEGLPPDVFANARTAVAQRPAPELPLAAQPVAVAPPPIPPLIEAALAGFHAAMIPYLKECEPTDRGINDSSKCAAARAKVRQLALATPGVLTHWLGRRWWPEWRAKAGDVDVDHVYEIHLELPVEVTEHLAYAAHRLSGTLQASPAKKLTLDEEWPIRDALYALVDATQLHLGDSRADWTEGGREAALLWLRFLAGKPLPDDLGPVKAMALQLALHDLTCGDYEREERAHLAISSGKLAISAEVKALQRQVLRNRWLTPTRRGYDREELPLSQVRAVLQTPLAGAAFPPIDRGKAPPTPARD